MGCSKGWPSSERMASGRKEARLLARLTEVLADGTAVADEDKEAVADTDLLPPPLFKGMLLEVVWRYLQSAPKKQRPCDTQ